MTVWILLHTHDLGDDREDTKMLGVYSSQAAADLAVKRFLALPGFKDAPDGFSIDEYPLDQDYWTEGYVTFY